jgi:hypothetical protein
MSSALYIILDREIPGADTFVNGKSLARHNDELEKIAKGLKVTPLMSFFSVSKEGLLAAAEEYGIDLNEAKSTNEEKWFTAEEGLRTVKALLKNLNKSQLIDAARIEADLREFIRVLELARANDRRWHLGVDY